jgi:hypothetical protein
VRNCAAGAEGCAAFGAPAGGASIDRPGPETTPDTPHLLACMVVCVCVRVCVAQVLTWQGVVAKSAALSKPRHRRHSRAALVSRWHVPYTHARMHTHTCHTHPKPTHLDIRPLTLARSSMAVAAAAASCRRPVPSLKGIQSTPARMTREAATRARPYTQIWEAMRMRERAGRQAHAAHAHGWLLRSKLKALRQRHTYKPLTAMAGPSPRHVTPGEGFGVYLCLPCLSFFLSFTSRQGPCREAAGGRGGCHGGGRRRRRGPCGHP